MQTFDTVLWKLDMFLYLGRKFRWHLLSCAH